MTNKSQKYIDLGYIDVDDDVFFEYNYEAANCFGYALDTWFMTGGKKHPNEENVILWFPKTFENEEWRNYITPDGKYIEETCLDAEKAQEHAEKWRNGEQHRIVFASVEDTTINPNKPVYKFLGLFKIVDVDDVTGVTLKRIATRVKTYPSQQDV